MSQVEKSICAMAQNETGMEMAHLEADILHSECGLHSEV